jgi:hypothetical protein
MKIPEPIMDPATIMVESRNPSSRTNPVVPSWALGFTARESDMGASRKKTPYPTGKVL